MPAPPTAPWMLPAARPHVLTEERELCDDFLPERQIFFGDLHVHSGLSFDAAEQGIRIRPAEAYRFARGEIVGIAPYSAGGKPLGAMSLHRPLDFAAVTDHAEFLDQQAPCSLPGAPDYDTWPCRLQRRWPEWVTPILLWYRKLFPAGEDCTKMPGGCAAGQNSGDRLAAWREIREAAQGAYDRSSTCSFTSFIGYEWTATPNGANLHRNVIFRNHIVPETPIDSLRAPVPELLWKHLEQQCSEDRKSVV